MGEESRINYYILFQNYTQGMLLHELLREEHISSRISPAPRSIQGELGCGMSLLIQPEDIDRVRECIEKHHAEYHNIAALPCQIYPRRNKFC